MVTLYYSPGTCSLASHIALEESGLKFQTKRIGHGDNAQRAELLKINPKGKVPALLIDGICLTENLAILVYIADRTSNLLPEDPLLRARCISLMSWFASTVHVMFRQTMRPEQFSNDRDSHASLVNAGHASFKQALAEIDGRFLNNDWVCGEQFTVADGYALVFYGWGLFSGYEMTTYSNYEAFHKRMIKRPGVLRALKREQSVMLKV